jgi:hypothetical protein
MYSYNGQAFIDHIDLIQNLFHIWPEMKIFMYIIKLKSNFGESIVTDLIDALPGNSSVNRVQHAATDEVVFFYVVLSE